MSSPVSMLAGVCSLLLVVCGCGVSAVSLANDRLNVHLVPHTHDDVGWLKTVDEYYYGANNSIQLAGVQYILDTVIDELAKDNERKFIYVEIAFFIRWWREQTPERQEQVREMVRNKQLEFINAGWCMNDEASTHYNAIIDQMSIGLRFVEQNFGPEARPRIGWHIDPFGHSAVQASLFAMMGFDGFFVGRISYDDKRLRLNHTNMEMVWRGSRTLTDKTDMFTAVNYNLYQPPPGFCYDSKCHILDPPIQMGFDGFFFARIDYDDKLTRVNQTRMEMVWSSSKSLQKASEIFTGVLYNHYVPPKSFCFDQLCSGIPIQDDPELFDYNVKERVDTFIKECQNQAKHYKTNNILLTMGSDFHYMDAIMWFKNLDKLIKYVRQNGSVNIMYSTPSIYLDALHQAGETWSVKTDDFFPYADAPWSYWTGYFTSRPALKGYVRVCNNKLQACKQMEAFHNGFQEKGPSSVTLQRAMGVSQHHDAISGTEKQHVANDYARRLHAGQVECDQLMHEVVSTLASKRDSPSLQLQSCEYLNISICPASETSSFDVVVYNPLARNWTGLLRVPISHNTVQVMAADGKELVSQVVPVSEATMAVRGKRGTAKYELVFSVDSQHSVPALGYTMFSVRNTPGKQSHLSHVYTPSRGVSTSISTDSIKVMFDSSTNLLMSITNMVTNVSLDVDQSFMWYNSSIGKNKNSTQASGAYIFRPNETTPIIVNGKPELSVVNGPLVNEVYQTFAPWLTQVIRVVPNSLFVEMEYTIGPIPFNDTFGKEIVTRYSTDVHSDTVWYTDANGREMQRRVRNFRPTWKWNNTAPVSGNYYPVNSRIYIRDEEKKVQLTVLTDRSQGGTSLSDGEVELMLHRRTLKDDSRGVAEPLNETGQFGKGLIIRGKHFVLVDSIDKSNIAHRLMAEQLFLAPQLSFNPSTTNASQLSQQYNTLYAGLTRELPPAVHLLTLEYMSDGKLLLRLEHQFEEGEGMDSKVTVSLDDLFTAFTVESVTELVLGGNALLSDVHRLQWKTDSMDDTVRESSRRQVVPPSFDVQLNPMEIRTFELSVRHH